MSGDLMQDRFGLDEGAYETLASQANIIIHMAATIDFTERLDVAVNLNVLGTCRVLALAQRAKALGALDAVVHVSTCYVNSNLPAGTRVREQLYPLHFNPRGMCTRILDMTAAEIDFFAPKLLKQYGYPNTYTFTKAIAEHMAADMGRGLPFAIFRPSVIGGALREPFPGWCDSASACGSVFLAIGLGVVQEFQGDIDVIFDLIPVDLVVNMLMVIPFSLQGDARGNASILHGTSSDVPIYHCGTSATINPISLRRMRVALLEYYRSNPIASHDPKIFLLPGWRYDLSFWLKRRVPAAALSACASLPGVPEATRKQAEQATKLVTKLGKLVDTFHCFAASTWYYETANSANLLALLPESDRETFCFDPLAIGWRAWIHNYCYGLVRYVLKLPVPDRPPVAADELSSARLRRAML
eukprot:TRINITY_DN1353_c0_g1_i1.p1 TRINITY_DN1353_c0_g1~~TRINITY_DN1353_c0_g1_i1.p1  ORF type:complete len:414 (+),score=100.57 TRINITY_DN1353_c0_g1_i1:249-1490(+)